jgi:hypothetical protein
MRRGSPAPQPRAAAQRAAARRDTRRAPVWPDTRRALARPHARPARGSGHHSRRRRSYDQSGSAGGDPQGRRPIKTRCWGRRKRRRTRVRIPGPGSDCARRWTISSTNSLEPSLA